jgi:hypothetical protein
MFSNEEARQDVDAATAVSLSQKILVYPVINPKLTESLPLVFGFSQGELFLNAEFRELKFSCCPI